MTHNELLAHINSKLKFCTCDRWIKKCWEDDNQPWLALRAVVELHKPIISTAFPEFLGICLTCSPPSLNFYEATRYPCSTIQAIEKELK